ncbi:UNVERIFIED_CONTAM: hypothetical protein GTU68_010664 [Idotea baltica]|nr:hypothetical protein [Idotea baltica]MCL4163106.1 hypothetical protein [Idotea baltica]
MMFVKHYQKLV